MKVCILMDLTSIISHWQCFLVALVWGVSMLQEKFDKDGMTIRDVIAKQNILFRWLLYLALIAGILVFGMYGSGYNAGAFFYGKF